MMVGTQPLIDASIVDGGSLDDAPKNHSHRSAATAASTIGGPRAHAGLIDHDKCATSGSTQRRIV